MSTTAQVPTTVTLTLSEELRAAAAETLNAAIEIAGPNPDADRAYSAITNAESDSVEFDLSATETLGAAILGVSFNGLFATPQQADLLNQIEGVLRSIVEEHGEEAYLEVARSQQQFKPQDGEPV